jgi:hypothetical protein
MEAIFSSEISVDVEQTARRYTPEDRTLQLERIWNEVGVA